MTCVCSILHDEAIKQVGYKSSHHVVNYYLWQRCTIAHMCGAWYAKLLNNFPNVILILGFKPPFNIKTTLKNFKFKSVSLSKLAYDFAVGDIFTIVILTFCHLMAYVIWHITCGYRICHIIVLHHAASFELY